MKADAEFCSSEDSLMKAAEIMRRKGINALPVMDEENRVSAFINENDICFTVAARNRKASAVKIAELNLPKAKICSPEDELEDALKKMRKNQTAHLAVINKTNEPIGTLSIFDVLLFVRKNKKLQKQVYSTMKAIFKPRPIVLREISADNNGQTNFLSTL